MVMSRQHLEAPVEHEIFSNSDQTAMKSLGGLRLAHTTHNALPKMTASQFAHIRPMCVCVSISWLTAIVHIRRFFLRWLKIASAFV